MLKIPQALGVLSYLSTLCSRYRLPRNLARTHLSAVASRPRRFPPTANMSTPAYKLKESHEQRADAEQTIQRNPHGNFADVQASRPDFDHSNDGFKYTKTVAPEWQLGQGAPTMAARA